MKTYIFMHFESCFACDRYVNKLIKANKPAKLENMKYDHEAILLLKKLVNELDETHIYLQANITSNEYMNNIHKQFKSNGINATIISKSLGDEKMYEAAKCGDGYDINTDSALYIYPHIYNKYANESNFVKVSERSGFNKKHVMECLKLIYGDSYVYEEGL